METLLSKLWPDVYQERLVVARLEASLLGSKYPVFVSSSPAFPHQAMVMHFFEPRYKHMIRYALETNSRLFTIICTGGRGERILGGDVGVKFFVQEYEFLPDGRAFIRCMGTDRVEVTDTWVDAAAGGLHWARVVDYGEDENRIAQNGFVDDQKVRDGSDSGDSDRKQQQEQHQNRGQGQWEFQQECQQNPVAMSSKERLDSGREEVEDAFRSLWELLVLLKQNLPQFTQIEDHYGEMPCGGIGALDHPLLALPPAEDVVRLSLWVSALCPGEPTAKMSLLTTTSTKQRLLECQNFLKGVVEHSEHDDEEEEDQHSQDHHQDHQHMSDRHHHNNNNSEDHDMGV